MADDVILNVGTGGDTVAADDIGGVKYQRVKLALGANNTNDGDVATGNPLPVSDAGGSLTVDYATTGNGTAAGAIRVSVASDSTGQIALAAGSAAIGKLTANTGVTIGAVELAASQTLATVTTVSTVTSVTQNPDIRQATASNLNAQVVGTIASGASDSGNPVKVGGRYNSTKPTLTDGQRGDMQLDAKGNQLSVIKDAAGNDRGANVNASNQLSVSVDAATTLTVGSHAVTNAGTFAVQASIATATTGGYTTYHLVSAATTNLVNVKNGAGTLYGWYLYNNATTMRKLAFHNSASAPTAGASIFFTLNLPPQSAANAFMPHGIAFSSGISISTVTDVTDAGTTAVSLSDLTINLWYA